MAGLIGLFFALAENSGTIGSKIPIVTFFFLIMIIGFLIGLSPKEFLDDTFGEVDRKREFS